MRRSTRIESLERRWNPAIWGGHAQSVGCSSSTSRNLREHVPALWRMYEYEYDSIDRYEYGVLRTTYYLVLIWLQCVKSTE